MLSVNSTMFSRDRLKSTCAISMRWLSLHSSSFMLHIWNPSRISTLHVSGEHGHCPQIGNRYPYWWSLTVLNLVTPSSKHVSVHFHFAEPSIFTSCCRPVMSYFRPVETGRPEWSWTWVSRPMECPYWCMMRRWTAPPTALDRLAICSWSNLRN